MLGIGVAIPIKEFRLIVKPQLRIVSFDEFYLGYPHFNLSIGIRRNKN